jgi:hypothetical protein
MDTLRCCLLKSSARSTSSPRHQGARCGFMSKRPTKQPQTHSWTVYQIKGAPAKLVGIVDAPG